MSNEREAFLDWIDKRGAWPDGCAEETFQAGAEWQRSQSAPATETNDQMAKVMLLHGTPEQQKEALQYAGIPTQIAPAGYVLVPVEPTPEMWGGLARDLMMWLDFGNPTVDALRKHLSMLNIEWPAWMDSESEMSGGGVPSKGTRATLIYKAMLAAAPKADVQEPFEYQYQSRDGKWKKFDNEGHYRNTVKDGTWPIMALYAAPQPSDDAIRTMADLLPLLDDALEDLELHGRHKDSGYNALKDWYRKMALATKAIGEAHQPSDDVAMLRKQLREAKTLLEQAQKNARPLWQGAVEDWLAAAPKPVQCQHMPISSDNGTWCELCEKKI